MEQFDQEGVEIMNEFIPNWDQSGGSNTQKGNTQQTGVIPKSRVKAQPFNRNHMNIGAIEVVIGFEGIRQI